MMLLLLGCSHGTFTTASGSHPLETAFFLEVDDPDSPTMYVILSTSYLGSCQRADLRDDPDEALEELFFALVREGSRVALLELNRYGTDTWEGLLPLADETFQPNQLSGQSPFIAQGSFLEVHEARVDRDEGLDRSYVITDATYVAEVAAPGQVSISRWTPDEMLSGALAFDALDASATFRAKPCDATYEDSILPTLESLSLLAEEEES